MKAKLSKEEFYKRRQKAYYEWQKEERIKKWLERYYRNKWEEEAMLEEIYKDVYDPLPEPINYDKYYTEKFREDDMDVDGKYRYYWRCSRLNLLKPSKLSKYTLPIRIYWRKGVRSIISQLWNMQNKAYEYIKPYIDELNIKDFKLSKKQFFTKAPMWAMSKKMLELTSATDISNNQICTVASALLRDKYIKSELYLWRVSFLVWDIIITQNGNVLRPCLENNIEWLNKDTVISLHDKRVKYLNWEDNDLQIYILWDCYLLEIHINEREYIYYLVSF